MIFFSQTFLYITQFYCYQVQQHQLVENLITNLQQKDHTSFKLALSTSEGVFFFDPQIIIRLEGENNYTRFYFTNQKSLLVSKTLKEYEDILTEQGFIRAHNHTS
ncbi:MAG: LytTR family transcriptional regulator DNA-binding domain-containing protein [Chitinophagaceae bacterium]